MKHSKSKRCVSCRAWKGTHFFLWSGPCESCDFKAALWHFARCIDLLSHWESDDETTRYREQRLCSVERKQVGTANLALCKFHLSASAMLTDKNIISLMLKITFQRLKAGIISWQKSVARSPTRLPLVNVCWQGMVGAVNYRALRLLKRHEGGIHFLCNTLLESKRTFFIPKRTIITLNWIPRRLVSFCSLCWSFIPIVSGLLIFPLQSLHNLLWHAVWKTDEKPANIFMHRRVWLRVSV